MKLMTLVYRQKSFKLFDEAVRRLPVVRYRYLSKTGRRFHLAKLWIEKKPSGRRQTIRVGVFRQR
jgi:hypothetical protein